MGNVFNAQENDDSTREEDSLGKNIADTKLIINVLQTLWLSLNLITIY